MKKFYFLALLALAVCFQAMAQERTVTGIVTDAVTGETLVGANVKVLGSTRGSTTDLDGKYTIVMPETAKVLSFTFIGYLRQDLEIPADGMLNVVLEEDELQLEQVVVTALGITREEKSLPYSTQQVAGEDLNEAREANIVNSLQGKVAGAQISGSSSNMGGSSRILLRGVSSVTGQNQPLFVVDGIPILNDNVSTTDVRRGGGGYDYGNTAQDINPDDVESVSVLKGQTASALYGSRAANGVILITTKKGTNRKGVGVSVRSGVTFEKVFALPDYQNSYGGGTTFDTESGLNETYMDELGYPVPAYGVDESWGPAFEGQMYLPWNAFDETDPENFMQPVPWEASNSDVEDFFETGTTFTNSIALSGGNDVATYRLSYSNLRQNGIMPNSEYTRHNIGFNGTAKMSDRLSTSIGVNYINNDATGRPQTGYSGGLMSNFNQWWQRQTNFSDLERYASLNGDQQTWNRQGWDIPAGNYWDNPYWIRYKNYQTDQRHRFYGNMTATYQFFDWLSLTGRIGSDFYEDRRQERQDEGGQANRVYDYDGNRSDPQSSYYAEGIFDSRETNLDLFLNIDRQLNDDFSLVGLIGGNRRISYSHVDYTRTDGGLNVPGFFSLQNSANPLIANDLEYKSITSSVFAQANIGYRRMLFLESTIRTDWNSTLPVDNWTYVYPSVGLGFVFTELEPLQNNRVLSFGKLRGSWAAVGSGTDPYRLYDVYNSVPGAGFGGNPIFTIPGRLNNAELVPERTFAWEIGLDMKFFRNRLGFDATYYSSKTNNQIIPVSVDPATGYTSKVINAGNVTNRGVELMLTGTPVKVGDFQWDITLNWAKNVNEVVELDEGLDNLALSSIFGASVNAFVGETYGMILGDTYLYDDSGNKVVDPTSGMYMTTAATVDGRLMPLGSYLADWTGGINNEFKYKGLNFSFLIDGQKGGNVFSLTNMFGMYSGIMANTAENGIREGGLVVEGNYPMMDSDGEMMFNDSNENGVFEPSQGETVITGEANATTVNASSFFKSLFGNHGAHTYDASFIKLREVKFGYTLPNKIFGNSGLKDFNISFVARNLAILHKNAPNIDPETATTSTRNVQGLEGGALPPTRSMGLNLSFNF